MIDTDDQIILYKLTPAIEGLGKSASNNLYVGAFVVIDKLKRISNDVNGYPGVGRETMG